MVRDAPESFMVRHALKVFCRVLTYVLILYLRYLAHTRRAATILLYSFLVRLPLHIFWRKMMMRGIKWDLAFSSSNKVDGDLTNTFVLPKVTSLRNWRSSSSTLVPSSALPPWKFGHVNWEIILYLLRNLEYSCL